MSSTQKLVIYDQVCVMCSRTILLLQKADSAGRLNYTGYQTPEASRLLRESGLESEAGKYIVYVSNGRFYTRSRAVLEILRDLGFPWNLLYFFIIVPPFIRNFVYGFIATHRHRFGGRV
jgi:predicted DCC family thiol-disulfide oxidoreductase YuxK